jgi:hypothetical protein
MKNVSYAMSVAERQRKHRQKKAVDAERAAQEEAKEEAKKEERKKEEKDKKRQASKESASHHVQLARFDLVKHLSTKLHGTHDRSIDFYDHLLSSDEPIPAQASAVDLAASSPPSRFPQLTSRRPVDATSSVTDSVDDSSMQSDVDASSVSDLPSLPRATSITLDSELPERQASLPSSVEVAAVLETPVLPEPQLPTTLATSNRVQAPVPALDTSESRKRVRDQCLDDSESETCSSKKRAKSTNYYLTGHAHIRCGEREFSKPDVLTVPTDEESIVLENTINHNTIMLYAVKNGKEMIVIVAPDEPKIVTVWHG